MAKTSAPKKNAKVANSKSKNHSPHTPLGDQSCAPFNEQDVKRRLGNFGGAGEHPRQGGRTAGIVGQTKQQNRTNNRLNKQP